MKFTDLQSFFQWLSLDSKNLYLLLITDDYERKQVLKKLSSLITSRGYDVKSIFGSMTDGAYSHLRSISLFMEKPCVICDGLETWSKEDLAKLQSAGGMVIFATSSKGKLASLYKKIEQEGVVVDLLGEKPWDKKKRLTAFIVKKCQEQQKQMSHVTLERFLGKVGVDFAFIKQEIDKLLLYTKDKATITEKDIDDVCCISADVTQWKLAENIVWENKDPDLQAKDASFVFGLISSIRMQLQLGYKLASILEQGKTVSDYKKSFANMFPKTLEKRAMQAKSKGSMFFRNGLQSLFSIDLLLRNGQIDQTILIDYFRAKLYV